MVRENPALELRRMLDGGKRSGTMEREGGGGADTGLLRRGGDLKVGNGGKAFGLSVGVCNFLRGLMAYVDGRTAVVG